MSKFEKYATIFIVVCLAIVAAGFACKVSYHRGYKVGWKDCLASIQVDTTQHTDTSSYVNPEPIIVDPVTTIPAGYVQVKAGTIAQLKARIAELEAAVLAAPADSTASPVEDTPVDVALPVERKVYQDSTYRAVVEGIQARLAEIQTFNTTTTITKVVKEPVFPTLMISPAVNVEVLPRSVFAGAGVVADYWTGSWQFSLEVGYGVNNILGPAVPGVDTYKGEAAAGMYGRGQVKYNLIRK